MPTKVKVRASERNPTSGPFHDVAFDLGGPGPAEVSHRPNLLDLGKAQAPFQIAMGVLGTLGLTQMFQNLVRRPALFGDPRQKSRLRHRPQRASQSKPDPGGP